MRQRGGGVKRVTPNNPLKAIERLAKREDADLYLFSAQINSARVDHLRSLIYDKKQRRENAIIFLTTFGGDPDSAFRLAAALRRNYKTTGAYLFGLCKSAGTLATISADRLVFGDFGELGPL